MSFPAKSFRNRKEELKLKKELKELAKQAHEEYSELKSEDKQTLLSQEFAAKRRKPDKLTTKIGNKLTRQTLKLQTQTISRPDSGSDHLDFGEGYDSRAYDPPSPSVELGRELFGSPDSHATRSPSPTRTTTDFHAGNSMGVASIRTNVNLNVIMEGRGVVDGERGSKTSRSSARQKKKKSRLPIVSAALPDDVISTPQSMPAILGSTGTTGSINFSNRKPPTAPESSRRIPAIVTPSEKFIKSRSSSAASASRFQEGIPPITPVQSEVVNMPEEFQEKDVPLIDESKPDIVVQEEAKPDDAASVKSEEEAELTYTDRIHSEIQSLSKQLKGSLFSGLGLTDSDFTSESFQPSNEKFKLSTGSDKLKSSSSGKTSAKPFARTPSPLHTLTERSEDVPSNEIDSQLLTPKIEKPDQVEEPVLEQAAAPREEHIFLSESQLLQISTPQDSSMHLSSSKVSELHMTSKSGEKSKELDMLDYEQALKDLELPVEVLSSDIIYIKGENKTIPLEDLTIPVPGSRPSTAQSEHTYLAFWDDKKDKSGVKSIHHFCTSEPSVILPAHLRQISRDYHTKDKFRVLPWKMVDRIKEQSETSSEGEVRQQTDEELIEELIEEIRFMREETSQEEKELKNKNQEDKRFSSMAQRILDQFDSTDNQKTMLQNLKRATDDLFCPEEEPPLSISGTKLEIKEDTSRLYWTPAPPKLNLPPGVIKNKLFPDYHGVVLSQDGNTETSSVLSEESESEESEEEDELTFEDRQARERVLRRERYDSYDEEILKSQSPSITDLKPIKDSETKLVQEEETILSLVDETTEEETTESEEIPRFTSVLDMRRQMQRMREETEAKALVQASLTEIKPIPSDEFADIVIPVRAMSQPNIALGIEETLCLYSDYDTGMRELSHQVDEVSKMKEKMKNDLNRQEEAFDDLEALELFGPSRTPMTMTTLTDNTRAESSSDAEMSTEQAETLTIATFTDKVQPSESKRSDVPTTRVSRKREKLKWQKERKKQIQEFLNAPPGKLSRSESLDNLPKLVVEQPEAAASAGRKRKSSIPPKLDFEEFKRFHSFGDVEDIGDWIFNQFWYRWFDERYPPLPVQQPLLKVDLLSAPTSKAKSSRRSSVVNKMILDEIEVIEPDDENKELYESLENEVTHLSMEIHKEEGKNETTAFLLCRRGAVYRKLGELKLAWNDLNKAIELEPQLLDAYWHRHLLSLLQKNIKTALDDLTFIIKNNSTSARAFRSRAEIYRQQGDATMSIVNYSQAIKLNPNEAQTYYQRAAMFEKRGDVLLALEDYKSASKLMPSKTLAMFNVGLYHFKNQNWMTTINDFTEILSQDNTNSEVLTYKGRAHAKMGQYEQSVKDLSAAIHLNPYNAVAYYHRGCILRKAHPKKALQDLSVSLLLDDSFENVNSYLHRGILYIELKRWEEAIPDFESALQLDRQIPSAHVNLGLIYMLRFEHYQKAIKSFTQAIKVDPTYIRAYVCRAEAFHKIHLLRNAILDYSRAVHLHPDVPDYILARGKLLLEQNNLNLASFHVKQASELNQGLGASATQQAVVQCFLHNYDQAINVLNKACRSKPVSSLYILLGKNNMKAKRFDDAVTSFQKALECMRMQSAKYELPKSSASVYFLIGMCYVELKQPPNTLEALNNAIKMDPEYAEAYYHRGLCKMKMRSAKGIHDFNRALAINPGLFQAFLSRASYYGMKGRYSKGIMNCNEAIKLQPKSVRAYLYRGALKYHIKAYGLAVKDLTEAVSIDCTCALTFFNRAVCYQEMKYFQKALLDYGTVLLLDNGPNLKVLQNRGLLYLEIGDVDNSLHDFLAAAKILPRDHKIQHTLGLCYHRLGRLEESVAAYSKALEFDSFFIDAYIGRGNAYMDFGHDKGNTFGSRDFMKALHLDPLCLPARVNLAYNLQVTGHYQLAWHQFTCAISQDSTCQSALEGRAIVSLQMGNTFGSLVDLNEALKIQVTAELLTNRGVVQQFLGDNVNAIRDYQAAIHADPSYPLPYYNAANLYFKQRQFKQALTYYSRSIEWDRTDECAVLNRGITKVMIKDIPGALEDFQTAIDLSPYSAHIYFNRGNLYASLGQFIKAEEDYTMSLSLNPGDALVYKRRADVLGKLSRGKEAIVDYKRAIIIQTKRQTGQT